MSYNASNDNQQQQTQDRGLKEAWDSVQDSFSSEGNYNGVKVLGGLAGVAAAGGLGYVGYNQWLQHHGKDDNDQSQQEFKQNACPVAVDPGSQTAQVVGAPGAITENDAQGDDNKKQLAVKILGGLAGVAAAGGLGYVGYEAWRKHQNKEDSPQTAEEFKQQAVPVAVDPQSQQVQVVGNPQAQVNQQYQQQLQNQGYQAQPVNQYGSPNVQGVHWQCQYGDQPFPSNAIRGGQENNGSPLYVARARHQDGSVQPGKAGPSTGGGCLYPYADRELYSSVFEILVGDQNAVRWVDVQGAAQSVQGTPVDAGRDTDGSPLYAAKVDYDGGCVPAKAGPNLHEACFGYEGCQKKGDRYQVLVQ